MSHAESHPDLLRPADAAKKLNISKREVYRCLKRGQLNYTTGIGRGVQIPAAAIAEFIAARTIRAAGSVPSRRKPGPKPGSRRGSVAR